MSRQRSLERFGDGLYISFSQIFSYLSCSLRYRFAYVEQKPPARIGIGLPFGRAIHASIERFYRALMNNQVEPLSVLKELFVDSLLTKLDEAEVPIIYKKETPDKETSIRMGKSLLEVFYEAIGHSEMDIVSVELPLSATLYNEFGNPTDFKLVGILDLLVKNSDGEIIPVDHKTWAKRKAQSALDKDLQFSSYAYLLAANKYVPFTAAVKCRLDVLRKLKKPKLEQFHTVRSASDRKRFAKIAGTVLAGVENQIFIPNYSWLCSDCGYTRECEAW